MRAPLLNVLRTSRIVKVSPLYQYPARDYTRGREYSGASAKSMTRDKASEGEGVPAGSGRHPRRLIFAPGDIQAPPSSAAAPTTASAITTSSSHPLSQQPASALPKLDEPTANLASSASSGTSTPSANAAVVACPSRAHQFVTNPPLRVSQIDRTSPLHQFHAWFRDPRLLPSLAPETCTLATASMPSGRVSARIVYLKELDERGWVVYSNWGSGAGKGAQVFGTDAAENLHNSSIGIGNGDGDDRGLAEGEAGGVPGHSQERSQGNKWAALTFHWPNVERQVRVEGLLEPLTREESETYWAVRERGSQIGAWASQQSKVLWSAPAGAASSSGTDTGTISINDQADEDDGRSVLENRVQEMEKKFAGTEEIPLPSYWGGVRLVPESVEFWQGRKSRLHDRFQYVRVHTSVEEGGEKSFRWRIQRLSP